MGVDVVVLAAGKGTRMKSQIPKVLHQVCNKPMLWHILSAAKQVSVNQTVVVGYGKQQVQEFLLDKFCSDNLYTVEQTQQLGTGHAVLCARNHLQNEQTLVLLGDTPLITEEELSGLIDYHNKNDSAVSVLTAKENNPQGYGRIIRDSTNMVKQIVEESDASEQEKNITEINTGIMIFKTSELLEVLDNLQADNQQGEYYLTDAIEIMYNRDRTVSGYQITKTYRTMGINDRSELAKAEDLMSRDINDRWMKSGVTIIDPARTYIDPEAYIGNDTVIYPGTQILGSSKIGSSCILGSETEINNSNIEDNCQIEKSKVVDSFIGGGTSIGPYAHIRPGSVIAQEVRIGNFVEVKNSNIGFGSKANHLAYIGDAEIGSDVNLGAGTVIVNYDGVSKHKTIIKDRAFIGCNSNLVAPVTIEEGAFVAAGSTVTDNVPSDSLAIARARQINKHDWVKKKSNS